MPLFTAIRALTILSFDHCFLRALFCVHIACGADADRLFSALRLHGIARWQATEMKGEMGRRSTIIRPYTLTWL